MKEVLSIDEKLKFLELLKCSTLENLSGFFIDLTVLSVEEEKEVKFLK